MEPGAVHHSPRVCPIELENADEERVDTRVIMVWGGVWGGGTGLSPRSEEDE